MSAPRAAEMESRASLDPLVLRRLAQVSDARGAADIVLVWGAIWLAVTIAVLSGSAVVWACAVVFIGTRQNALATLAHDGWHRLICRDGARNHAIGAWLYAYPIGIPYHHDRRRHLRHHRDVGEPRDPDWLNYSNEGRETPLRLGMYFASLLAGRMFWQTSASLARRGTPRIALDEPASARADEMPLRGEMERILVAQATLFLLMAGAGPWWTYFVLWALPVATFAGFLANLRAFLEHCAPTDDVGAGPRLHDFEIGWAERLFVAPCHFNYHALHHAFVAVPHWNLPRAKAALMVAAGGSYPLEVQRGYLRRLIRHLAEITLVAAPESDADRGGRATTATAESQRSPELQLVAAAKSQRLPESRCVVDCGFCGSAEHEPVTGWLVDEESAGELPPAFRDLTFRFVRCTGCGQVYMRERPSPRDLDVFYGQAYKCFQSYDDRGPIMAGLARLVARGKLREIRRAMPPGRRRLLDYGCGSGTWLDLMQGLLRGSDDGFEMIGTDVTPGPLEDLRRRGIAAFCCDETTLGGVVEPGSVGVVHLFHVIEHVPDVDGTLAALYRVLAPGGVLMGQTPNTASLGRRVFGDLWNQWHVPRHLVLFDDMTLRRVAERAGFEVVSIRSSLSGATQWALSALLWRAKRRGREFRGIHEPLYPPLILAALPVAALEALVARTCHMDFVLRKPG